MAQRRGELTDGPHHTGAVVVDVAAGGERVVDLHDRNRQRQQLAERRVARAEVVDGEADPGRTETTEGVRHLVDVGEAVALGQFDDEMLRGQAVARHQLADVGHQVFAHDVQRRDVHRSIGAAEGRMGAPPLQRSAGVAEHLPTDVADDPDLLGQRDEHRRRYEAARCGLPTGKQLHPCNSTGGHVDDRLAPCFQLVRADGLAKGQFEAAALGELRPQTAVEHHGLTAPVALGVGQRLVRLVHQAMHIGIEAVHVGDAHAGRHIHVVGRKMERLLEGADDAFSQLGRGDR